MGAGVTNLEFVEGGSNLVAEKISNFSFSGEPTRYTMISHDASLNMVIDVKNDPLSTVPGTQTSKLLPTIDPTASFLIGQSQNFPQKYNGSFTELIIFSGSLTAGQRATLFSNQYSYAGA